MSNSLKAGFARADISPRSASVPLAGYGATSLRMSARIQDPLFVHATALESGDERCVLMVLDNLCAVEETVALWRKAIGERTGLPANRVFISTTHTHSAPDLRSALPSAIDYRDVFLTERLADTAARAVADLKPAQLSYGTVEVGRPGFRMNFDRHYYAVPIEKKNSYTKEDLVPDVGAVRSKSLKGEDYATVEHVEEADHSLQLMRFARDAADDIILMNFAAHATVTGGTKNPTVSSDYPDAFIRRLEMICPGTKCMFLQGCAGNLVAQTRLEREGVLGVTIPATTKKAPDGTPYKTTSHYAYGAALAGYAFKALLRCMKPSATDGLSFRQKIYTGTHDHSEDHLVPQAQKVVDLFRAKGSCPEVKELCAEIGMDYHHCISIVTNAAQPQTGEIELNAIRVGDCAITTLPFEPFSSIGEHIKEASPFEVTFVNGYSCGYQSYMPNKQAHPDCYESCKLRYLRGTGEILEEELGSLLQELK